MSNSRESAPASSELSLVCFAHAGGGTARYKRWQQHLPQGMRLVLPVLPGRDSRAVEAPLTRVHAVIQDALAQVEREGAQRIAVVGLSFGATVAYEFAAQWEAVGRRVDALFVANQRAPSTPVTRDHWHLLDDAALASRLVNLGGLSQRNAQDKEFLRVFLATIRADLEASERYVRPSGRARLQCPIHLYHGLQDRGVTADHIAAWREESATVQQRSLQAGHFLMTGARDLWFEALRPDLERLLARVAGEQEVA